MHFLGLCLAVLPAATALSCAQEDAQEAVVAPRPRPNLLLVILDDVGVEKIGAYRAAPPGAAPPCTPNIDALAAQGVLFQNAWGDPVCSPTRAQILTGRHDFRTGIGEALDFKGPGHGLALGERTLPELLAGYDSSAVGKWHLAPLGREALRHPLDSGFGYFAGTLFNIATPAIQPAPEDARLDCSAGGPPGYRNWVKVEDADGDGRPEQRCVTTYATTDTADDAIARARVMRAPWFLQVGFNAAHPPLEMPPEALRPAPGICPPAAPAGRAERFQVFDAMVTALDAELGRMLAEIRRVDPEVVVLLIGDNGTPIASAEGARGSCFGPERVKFSLYEGGVRVPLIVAGPGIVPGPCAALVSATDVFATLGELAGVSPTEGAAEDSVSMRPYLAGARAPLRKTVYAETFRDERATAAANTAAAGETRRTRHARAIRGPRYKLMRARDEKGTREQLFDLELDPCETRDLLQTVDGAAPALTDEQRAHLAELRAALVELGVYD